MFFTKPDLTSGSRPTLLPDEELLFVQDSVGLYEGKFKIATCQKGHAYLTSHRACYVDDAEPRTNSLAIDLKDVEKHDFQAGFLRSSGKVTLTPKPLKRGFGSLRSHAASNSASGYTGSSASSPVTRVSSPFRDAPARAASPQLDRGVWICTICAFSNPVPSNFDATIANNSFPLPPCLMCGIKPEFAHVLKAAVAATSKIRSVDHAPFSERAHPAAIATGASPAPQANTVTCPRCTFSNHKSMRICEVCGAPLPVQSHSVETSSNVSVRPASPGPEIAALSLDEDLDNVSIKFSFRAGGDKVFYEKLRGAMVQRRWLLQHAPPIPKPEFNTNSRESGTDAGMSKPQPASVGIAGLEQRGLRNRRDNEAVLGGAFEDLEALMSSAKDIVALAEKFAAESGSGANNALVTESAAALGLMATKDMVGASSNTLYVTELARNLAEYVTDERRGILRANGGIVALVDLWATVNSARNGAELISPADFHDAAEAWDRLMLPVRLRAFRSGLLVVQPRDWTDEKTITQVMSWLKSLQASPPEELTAWDWSVFGCGVTAQEVASRFGWSLGVANEELEMAEEKGVLCREEGIEGLKFWLNHFMVDDEGQ